MRHPLTLIRRIPFDAPAWARAVEVPRRRVRLWRDSREGVRQRCHSVQDDLSILYGTPITWSDTTGTYAITLNALASGSLRQGVKSGTLITTPSGLSTAVLPAWLEIQFIVQFNGAVSAGGEVGLYLGFSDSATAGTRNPAGLTGTDAAGPNVDTLGQLVLAGSLVASANLGGSVNQQVDLTVRPLAAYVCPVVYNNSSVALKASNDVTVIRVTPAWLVRST